MVAMEVSWRRRRGMDGLLAGQFGRLVTLVVVLTPLVGTPAGAPLVSEKPTLETCPWGPFLPRRLLPGFWVGVPPGLAPAEARQHMPCVMPHAASASPPRARHLLNLNSLHPT